MSRPECQAPPEIYYNQDEASRYTSNSRVRTVQTALTERALELLLLPEASSSLVLDVGCGSGISGEVLTEKGHTWIGLDISRNMLEIAVEDEADGDVILADMGDVFRFRAGVFDGAVSISAVQWLCNADKTSHNPYRRLSTFFKWLYHCLVTGARAVLQFYPDNAEQLEMITSAALRSGFGGGLVVDFPNSTKAKKHFLVLWAGMTGANTQSLPQGLTGGDEMGEATTVTVSGRLGERRGSRSKKRGSVKDREWVLHKKETQRHQGRAVRPDTKYTGRKRKDKF